MLDKPGGVFIRRQDITPADDLATLRAVARVELRCDSDLRLSEILEVPDAPLSYPAPFEPRVSTASAIVTPSTLAAAAARSVADGVASAVTASAVSRGPTAPPPANGLGALAADGAYEIVLRDGTTTPAPWSNVIANERAGFVVSDGTAAVTRGWTTASSTG